MGFVAPVMAVGTLRGFFRFPLGSDADAVNPFASMTSLEPSTDVVARTSQARSDEAREIVRRWPIFDAHVDSIGRALDLGHDLGVRGPGHLDLVRAREGGLGAWVVVCWVDPEHHLDRSFRRAADMLRAARELEARHPDRFRLVGNGRELEDCRAAGLIAGIPGIEGGHAIEESLEKLAWFFEGGLRVMTLVWNNHLSWVRSCQPGAGAGVPAGISGFGRDVVREMNRLGMLVDLSHAGDRAFFDVLETSERPPIASHSGCRALHDHPRNLSDEQLRALADRGGVVGIVFHPGFLDSRARADEARVRSSLAYRSLRDPNPMARFLAQQEHMRRAAPPLDCGRLIDHVVHAVEVAGVEHVGLGSDFDGIERGPAGLEDASAYPRIAELCLERGFTPDEVGRILWSNMERVFAQATGEGTRAGDAGRASPVTRP